VSTAASQAPPAIRPWARPERRGRRHRRQADQRNPRRAGRRLFL